MRPLRLLLLTLTACSPASPSTAPAQSPAPPTPVPPASAAATAAPASVVSEGFENGAGDWQFGGKGYDVGLDSREAHDGKASLRFAFQEAGAFGVSVLSIPVGGTRSKEATLGGWIKTEAVERGFAGFWMRIDAADGTQLALENMQATNIHGTTPWRRYEISLKVPDQAARIVFGGLLTGSGKAWVDDLSITAADAVPVAPVAVEGSVRDLAGKPVAGAVVALVGSSSWRASATTRTGADGRFRLTIPAGRYALTATATGGVAGYRTAASFDRAVTDADVTLGAGPSFTVTGKVRIPGSASGAGTLIFAQRSSHDEGDVFYAATDESGSFTLTLPAASGYTVGLDDRGLISMPASLGHSVDQAVELVGTPRAAAPDAVVDWVKQAAIPIATPDPAHDLTDLEPLGALIGSARVVALGEATHGTREFFQLKHRLLEYLVAQQGFTVFAIEANYPESFAVNDYVLHGTGDAKKALAGMYFWTWDTEEVRDQIEWMRRWNADAKHAKKVKFIGFDMQTAFVAAGRVLDYLRKVDPAGAKGAADSLAPLSQEREASYAKLPDEQKASTAKAIGDLLALFDRQKARWSARTSAAEWALARQDAVIVSQAERDHAGGGFDWRDESMAKNVRWILDNEPKGSRIVIWAHNAHVNKSGLGRIAMGSHLARDLGKDYLTLGFVFDRGAFQAMSDDHGFVLGEHSVGEARAGDVAAPGHRAGAPILALDLRRAPASGVVADWLAAPHPMHEAGAVFSSEEDMTMTVVLPWRFDAIVYVDATTRARPLGSGTP